MTEADSKLRHILGTFFPHYCSMSKTHQLNIEEAFLPTLKILFNAPVTSPLVEVDVEDVGMFFVHLTRVDMLQNYDNSKSQEPNLLESSTTTIHDNLAMSLSNQILSDPGNFHTKVLVKILCSLVITHNNYVHLKELKVLSESLLKSIKERSCLRYSNAFYSSLR